MLDYKKLLNFIMLDQSAANVLLKGDLEMYKIYTNRCLNMLNSGTYFTDEEYDYLMDEKRMKAFEFYKHREVIDEIFKLMGIYKEEVYDGSNV